MRILKLEIKFPNYYSSYTKYIFYVEKLVVVCIFRVSGPFDLNCQLPYTELFIKILYYSLVSAASFI